MKLENQALLRVSPADTHSIQRRWLPAAALAAAITAWLLLWYLDTTASIVRIWMRSETFAHGFVIAPISAYLIWRKRAELAKLAPTPAIGGLLLLAAIGFGWLLGNLAHARVV